MMQTEKARLFRDDEVLAKGISADEYMEKYAHDFAEYVDGVVIRMTPVSRRHNDLSRFLEDVFTALLPLVGGGEVLQAPMVMIGDPNLPHREPDLQVFLAENVHRIKETYVEGAADLVIEIISPESDRRDRVDKFDEYERVGVKEYWMFDARFQEALFYQLDATGHFVRVEPDANGVYQSKVFPKLRLPVALLWRDPLPDYWEVGKLVQEMLSQE
jgi:Uma2 family endonuclease